MDNEAKTILKNEIERDLGHFIEKDRYSFESLKQIYEESGHDALRKEISSMLSQLHKKK